ncbi:MAG: enoyl-CoA hydratase/isomerase family protein [Gemmatimonadota bacterium]|nr:enoyl-CoA hydratase/isomerase family protein [Gemmatimonadota bacterium]
MIDRSIRNGVTLLEMRREPANVLDLEFAGALEAALRSAGEDGTVSALVLTGTGGVFSAGVDLFRLLGEEDDYLDRFLTALDGVFGAAAEFPKPLVAAVNGHAIAGGGVLALACDARVMAAGTARIGLPELKVGVPFPSSVLSIARAVVPAHRLREVILFGRTFHPEEALERGLIDEIAQPLDVVDRAVALAVEMAGAPARSFELTKRLLRQPGGSTTAPLEDEVREVWADPATRAHIADYLEATLGKRIR